MKNRGKWAKHWRCDRGARHGGQGVGERGVKKLGRRAVKAERREVREVSSQSSFGLLPRSVPASSHPTTHTQHTTQHTPHTTQHTPHTPHTPHKHTHHTHTHTHTHTTHTHTHTHHTHTTHTHTTHTHPHSPQPQTNTTTTRRFGPRVGNTSVLTQCFCL